MDHLKWSDRSVSDAVKNCKGRPIKHRKGMKHGKGRQRTMGHRLKKNNLGFSACFFGQFKLQFVQYIMQEISYIIYKTNYCIN